MYRTDMHRTDWIRVVLPVVAVLFAAMLFAHGPEQTQATQGGAAWPQQQVTVVVPFAAGGSTDVIARLVAQHMQAKLGQPFVVLNKSGAGGAAGSAALGEKVTRSGTLLGG